MPLVAPAGLPWAGDRCALKAQRDGPGSSLLLPERAYCNDLGHRAPSGNELEWIQIFEWIEPTMPYFVYRITAGPTDLAKSLELQEEFSQYKDARNFAREQRKALGPDTDVTIKVIFAANPLEAEERLMEHREAPILREWEK